MSAKRTVVKVTILGQEFSIRSDTPAEHTLAVAEHVDKTIRGIMSGGGVIESHKAAILAAMQIAGELFETRDASRETESNIRRLSGEVRRLLPPAKRGETTA